MCLVHGLFVGVLCLSDRLFYVMVCFDVVGRGRGNGWASEVGAPRLGK